ncbi:MAG: dihydrodipicolinate synthase family protein [Sphaerochaetaceae bacterium]|nr:dihydrodipicolinate synthase family protein [Sphaerochaetaceae bacterium]
MNHDFLKGIIAPLVTPFDSEGNVDLIRAKKEIEILLDANVDAISPGGSTGEGAALTDDELVSLIRTIRSVDKDIPVVAGIIRNSTKAAIQTAVASKQSGADALMITPVSYNVLVPDEEGNFRFYEEIGSHVDLPIVIYNVVPQNTINAPLFCRLLKIIQVVGIKQSVGGIQAMYEMRRYSGTEGKVFSATDDMLYSTFDLGADGAISAILTVFPSECVQMWNLTKAGRQQEALALQNRMYFVWQAIAGNQFPIRIKYALSLLGRDCGCARSPIWHISDDDKKRIKEALYTAGFLR